VETHGQGVSVGQHPQPEHHDRKIRPQIHLPSGQREQRLWDDPHIVSRVVSIITGASNQNKLSRADSRVLAKRRYLSRAKKQMPAGRTHLNGAPPVVIHGRQEPPRTSMFSPMYSFGRSVGNRLGSLCCLRSLRFRKVKPSDEGEN
jgi:hypothetical protein